MVRHAKPTIKRQIEKFDLLKEAVANEAVRRVLDLLPFGVKLIKSEELQAWAIEEAARQREIINNTPGLPEKLMADENAIRESQKKARETKSAKNHHSRS